jgi:transmembrane sensor
MASWLERHPDDAILLEALDAAFDEHLASTALSERSVDVESALDRLHRRMAAASAAAPTLEVSRGGGRSRLPGRRLRWSIGGLAAAAVIGFFAVSLRRDAAAPNARAAGAAIVAAGSDFRTPVGVLDSLRLPDGTGVLLAPGSRLVVSDSYGRRRRDVTIEGMARFSVRHDGAAPFIVHAGPAVIRDVGTEFMVRAPDATNGVAVAVAVTDGEVAFSASPSSASATHLRAGDRAELHPDGEIFAQIGAVTTDDLAWTHGVLTFHAAPLDVVRDDLRRWFGIDLRIGDSSIASRRLTATFEKQSVDQVLNTIALALGAEMERSGVVATLRRSNAGR